MDTITHGLTGSLLATAIFVDKKSGQRDKPASLSLIIGSIFPDIDFIFGIFGSLATIKYHRGFTHSLTGALLFALIWAFLYTRFSSYKNFKKIFFAFAVGLI
ncbi:MAG: metal-dependent hydrolase, partial [Candidatus Tectomicrobia bacterium]|nr:metal-dependent hydrolase [Candidatus Tectomicrobia bacterium]